MIQGGKGINLGNEIEDVTARVRGIAIGRIEYLDGSKAWLIQPQYGDDGSRMPIVEVQDAYSLKVGEGVFVEPKPPLGFYASKGAKSGE